MYYTCGTSMLVRAAAVPVTSVPDFWPDIEDSADCREWLEQAWACGSTPAAIELASPMLARRISLILAGIPVPDRRVRAATASVVRYMLRASGRPTPFGLFAGVAAGGWANRTQVMIGSRHRAVLKCDSQWLSDITARLEAQPDLLERLDVVFSNLAIRRGSRLELATGEQRVSIRYTSPVHAARTAAAAPVRFGLLAGQLAGQYPGRGLPAARGLLQDLVSRGFLITGLRAPMTETDALGYLLGQLHAVSAASILGLAPLIAGLNAVHRSLLGHSARSIGGQTAVRARLSASMRQLEASGRPPLCADLLLDCNVQLPATVASDLAAAATVLTRLSPNPAGPPEWAGYHELFAERYGVGALVPLLDVLDPGTGLGFPAGYPGSALPAQPSVTGPRDERLAALAWRAVARGQPEVALTDEIIRMVTAGDTFDSRYVQPHVELAASVRAASQDALDRGDYTLAIAPARAAGTLTSRFSPVAAGSGLQDIYRHVPPLYAGALPVQLSFPPLYPRGENVARMPAFLDHILPLGEHRPPGRAGTVIGLDELAVAATRRGLVLVWQNTGQVIEPQVFHALALQKQVPPLARFLANLPRAFAADYLAFDWGACARLMPYLPQLRYGRTILSPARWRLTGADLPDRDTTPEQWHHALVSWQGDLRCPDQVELHDGDLTLRLDLRIPAHAASIRDHLARRASAILTPACDPALLGWLNGHCHEVAVPLVRVGPPAPAQLPDRRPLLTGSRHGHLPAAPAARWLTAKLFAHPDCLHEIITTQLPCLIARLEDAPAVWFVRYRAKSESDHLRLRIRVGNPAAFGVHANAVAGWADQLRAARLIGRLTFDTYYPETGRYGSGEAMTAAETVFAADSATALAQLARPPAGLPPVGVATLSMLDLAEAFLGGMPAAATWLVEQRPRQARPVDRSISAAATSLARLGTPREMPTAGTHLAAAMQYRAAALARYRAVLQPGADTGAVLESLLHLHHNRVLGIDPSGEASCRRLLRHAALAWQSAQQGTAP